jgi:hypothetical protein
MKYTPKDIEERFEEAAATLRRLPDARVPGYFSTWPPIIRAAAEAYGYDPARMPRIAPVPAGHQPHGRDVHVAHMA